jgi:hypothetical protein
MVVLYYDSITLLSTYGVWLLLATICAILGLGVTWRNKASYSNQFSTILRATRGKAIDEAVVSGDDGASPMPETLGELEIRLGSGPNGTAEVLLKPKIRE